jgi:signal transduction histidine kinase
MSITAKSRRWPWRLPVAFVLLTLVALVAVPWAVQRRVGHVRDQIVSSEPARTLVLEWQFDMVREMDAVSELTLTGDSSQLKTYDRVTRAERRVHEQLLPLARDLGPEVLEHFTEARTLAEQWHSRVENIDLLRERTGRRRLMQDPVERSLFEEVLGGIAAVDSAIIRDTERARLEIESAERAGLIFTQVLGALALLAALALFMLEARVRRFAEQAEVRRQEAAHALAESARTTEARTRLMRGVTHDVKNPLGAARGYTELLAMGVKGPLTPEQVPLVEGAQRSIDSALAIIADLLDFARVDSGGMAVNHVEVDLGVIVREAVTDYRAQAATTGHAIEAEAAEGNVVAFTDPLRVRQVLDNLISNAIKYTPPPGRIAVRLVPRVESPPLDTPACAIEVSDTGPGVPPDRREAVFEEFTRLDEGSAAKGHGLGLAIARGVARLLGGELSIADTTPGATFVFLIPLDRRGPL